MRTRMREVGLLSKIHLRLRLMYSLRLVYLFKEKNDTPSNEQMQMARFL